MMVVVVVVVVLMKWEKVSDWGWVRERLGKKGLIRDNWVIRFD
jgi:hypothetical protein